MAKCPGSRACWAYIESGPWACDNDIGPCGQDKNLSLLPFRRRIGTEVKLPRDPQDPEIPWWGILLMIVTPVLCVVAVAVAVFFLS